MASDILEALDRGDLAALTMIDLSAAFDAVLMHRLVFLRHPHYGPGLV